MRFDKEAVGKTIRNLRNKKGISQEVLSGIAGIARTHLTMIENNDKQANFETLWKIANALDIRPSELVSLIEKEIERSEIPDEQTVRSTVYMKALSQNGERVAARDGAFAVQKKCIGWKNLQLLAI